MSIAKVLATCVVVAVVGGCAATTYELNAPFDRAQAEAMLVDGPNTIKGGAFLRQVGGGVVTCAGAPVHLIPATSYARLRMKAIYGVEGSAGYSQRGANFEPERPEYLALVRTVTCDQQGNFLFEQVADGDFFVVTTVAWKVGYTYQGGNLMARVAVGNGQTKSLVMSP